MYGIRKLFYNYTSSIIVTLHLEYSIQAWRPHFRQDIDLIEGVQRRATKLISDIKGCTYEERLSILKLTTLETRRLRGDLIEVFKMCKGFDNLEIISIIVL